MPLPTGGRAGGRAVTTALEGSWWPVWGRRLCRCSTAVMEGDAVLPWTMPWRVGGVAAVADAGGAGGVAAVVAAAVGGSAAVDYAARHRWTDFVGRQVLELFIQSITKLVALNALLGMH